MGEDAMERERRFPVRSRDQRAAMEAARRRAAESSTGLPLEPQTPEAPEDAAETGGSGDDESG